VAHRSMINKGFSREFWGSHQVMENSVRSLGMGSRSYVLLLW